MITQKSLALYHKKERASKKDNRFFSSLLWYSNSSSILILFYLEMLSETVHKKGLLFLKKISGLEPYNHEGL